MKFDPRHLGGPLIAAAFAGITAIGTTQDWGQLLVFAQVGTDDVRGRMTFIIAIIAIVLCLARALLRLPDPWYYLPGLFLAGCAVVLPLSYLLDVHIHGNIQILGNKVEVASVGSGVYVSLIGAIGFAISLVAQLLVLALERRGNYLERVHDARGTDITTPDL